MYSWKTSTAGWMRDLSTSHKMHPKVRAILISFKAEIVDSLSEGSLRELLNKLAFHLVDEDRQKVECDSAQRGHSWAADTLLDRVKYSDDDAFADLLLYLGENKSTQELHRMITEECRKQHINITHLRKNGSAARISGSSKEAAKAFLKAINPIVAESLSEGEFQSMLRRFEADLQDQDIQKIKCDLSNLGHYSAVTRMINCLMYVRKRTLKKFIKYLSENKKSLFMEIKVKLYEYGLQNLLKGTNKDEFSEPTIIQPGINHDPESPDNIANDERVPIPETKGPDITGSFDSIDINGSSNTNANNGIGKYTMSNEPCGICLIINNEDFSQTRKGKGKEYTDREGSNVDEENLCELFSWLNFVVRKLKNKKALEMYKILKKLSEENHSEYNCLVVCILTHGLTRLNKDEILGVDGSSVPVDKLTSLFDGARCNSLNGKPKLFFLQCCRGKWEDKGATTVGAIQHDGPDIQVDDGVTLPLASDFFIGYSTPPGFKSWRHITEGSWYIATLCKVFSERAQVHDLMTMAAEVNGLVSEYSTDKDNYQIPNPTMTLRKLLFFNPKPESLK